LKNPSRPNQFFSLDPSGSGSKPAGRYVRAYTRGFYGEMSNTPERLEEYVSANSLNPIGPVYVLYIQDEVSVPEPDNYLAQTTVRIG
jgi:effector-binding domain-containing protein